MSNPSVEDLGPLPPQVFQTAVEVYFFLRLLLNSGTPLLINFPERSLRYQTFLIDISLEQGHAALHELVPNDGERLLLTGESFSVEGFYDGVRIGWQNISPVHIDALGEARCYWVPFPAGILYHQRRNAYRAKLRGAAVEIMLCAKAIKKPLGGRMLDISATGCKISLAGNHQSKLQAGQIHELCARLPFDSITIAVEVRHVSHDQNLDVTVCGLRFHRLDGPTQRNIERLVYQLQREARRDQAAERGVGNPLEA